MPSAEMGVIASSGGGGGFTPQLAQLSADVTLPNVTTTPVLTLTAAASGQYVVNAVASITIGINAQTIEVFLTVNGVVVAATNFSGTTSQLICLPLVWMGHIGSGQNVVLSARVDSANNATAKAATLNSGTNTATTLAMVQTQ